MLLAARSGYPDSARRRTDWILSLRGMRNPLDPERAYAAIHEEEIGPDGRLVPTSTILLANAECPFRCVFCDLWRNTLPGPTRPGDVPRQIERAISELPPASQVKLYNAGSFFDPRAIPPADDAMILPLLQPFDRVIVECHPAFVGERAKRYAMELAGKLEVAIGLETAHPEALVRLNKRMTLEDFRRAADYLRQIGSDLRVFLILGLPWMTAVESLEWTCRSIDLAFAEGATAVTVIPARDGNGAMEALERAGEWSTPSLRSLELAVECGIGRRQGRVFADTWDLERLSVCSCSGARIGRLEAMNRTQVVPSPIPCAECQAT